MSSLPQWQRKALLYAILEEYIGSVSAGDFHYRYLNSYLAEYSCHQARSVARELRQTIQSKYLYEEII